MMLHRSFASQAQCRMPARSRSRMVCLAKTTENKTTGKPKTESEMTKEMAEVLAVSLAGSDDLKQKVQQKFGLGDLGEHDVVAPFVRNPTPASAGSIAHHC